MKKVIVAVAGISVIVVAAMPWVTGWIAETSTEAVFSAINQRSFEYGSVTVLDYQRGYKSTDLSFQWTPPALYQSRVQRVELGCRGVHGFLSYAYSCTISHADEYTDFVKQYLQGHDPLSVSGSVDLLGNVTQSLQLTPFTWHEENAGSLTTDGAEFSVTISRDLSRIDLAGSAGPISVEQDQDKVQLSPVQLQGHFSVNDYGISIGQITSALEQLVLTDSSGATTFNALQLEMLTDEHKENLDLSYLLTIADINRTELADTEVSNLQLSFALQGLDMEHYAAIEQQFAEFGQRAMAASSQIEMQAEQMQLMSAIVPHAEALLKPGLTFRSHLAADLNREPLGFDLDWALIQRMTSAELVALMFNPPALVNKMTAHVAVQIPSVLLAKEPVLAARLQNSPLFTTSANGASTQIVLEKDNVTLNGKPTTIPALMEQLRQAQ